MLLAEAAKIVSERVGSHAIEKGYRRKGWIYYKQNSNDDLVLMDLRLTELRSGVELIVVMSLTQGLKRRRRSGTGSGRLPVKSYDQGNDWYWVPDAPHPYARENAEYAWADITMWGADVSLEREAVEHWFPVLDRLAMPGALSAEMRIDSSALPGEFLRTDFALAFSLLNDGAAGLERVRLLSILEAGAPGLAAEIVNLRP